MSQPISTASSGAEAASGSTARQAVSAASRWRMRTGWATWITRPRA